MAHHNMQAKLALKKLRLMLQEWELLHQLDPILKVWAHSWYMLWLLIDHQPFLKATLRMSQSKVPLLHEVIPLIDTLTHKLEDAIIDHYLLPAVRSAAAKGLAVLHKYYSKSDKSIMYRCAMSSSSILIHDCYSMTNTYLVLHPQYKLTYFQHEKWPQLWISTAEDIICNLWMEHYKPQSQEGLPLSKVYWSNLTYSEHSDHPWQVSEWWWVLHCH